MRWWGRVGTGHPKTHDTPPHLSSVVRSDCLTLKRRWRMSSAPLGTTNHDHLPVTSYWIIDDCSCRSAIYHLFLLLPALSDCTSWPDTLSSSWLDWFGDMSLRKECYDARLLSKCALTAMHDTIRSCIKHRFRHTELTHVAIWTLTVVAAANAHFHTIFYTIPLYDSPWP